MDQEMRTILWQQFGAAIDMFGNAVRACPEEVWRVRLWRAQPEYAGFAEFWCIASHTLFWLDLYLSGSDEGFTPPPPFGLEELDPAGALPPRVYTQAELLAYLDHCRAKCKNAILELTDEQAQRICTFGKRQMSYAELLLYTMRHVQEHGAQLSMALGQSTGYNPGWVAKARE